MATTTIKKSRLDALRQHIIADGDSDLETVATLLGLEADDEEGVQAYVAHLKQSDPELFGIQVADEPKAEVIAAPESTAQHYQILDENNLLSDLEVVKSTSVKVILRRKVPREIVIVRLGGKDVELDILELQRADQSEVRHGLAVSTLLTIARAAK